VRSCLIDGEAVCCDDNGMAVFAKLRQRRNDRRVVLYAFDLLELDGQDLRREPLVRRKVLLARLLARARVGLQVNDHIVEPGDVVFRHACQLGFEGIERLGSPYVSARSRHWIKNKNPQHPAGSGRGLEPIAKNPRRQKPWRRSKSRTGAAGRSRPPLQRSHLLAVLCQQSFNQ
jgi:hypothetical protein